ncbi:hypothetical protein GF402_08465 [Candidatus Fermentibacteria bacterium]|nr:hypothetical protein [Candidatus Fermentibacteria bacterium]
MRVLYVLDFLPTYVEREIRAVANGPVRPEVMITSVQGISRVWDRILAEEEPKPTGLRKHKITNKWISLPIGNWICGP